MNPAQDHFKRQITLAEFGEEGQKKLLEAKVLVVGCGGLGSPVAVYLAASGIGELHLIDFDRVATHNLHRQVYYSLNDVGRPKAEVLANYLSSRAPYTKVSYSTIPLTKDNVKSFVESYDIVVDGTDSLPTKYLLNDACVLAQKPLVYGSLYKFDGYVGTFNVLNADGTFTAHLRDAFPVMATDVPTCETAGTLNAIVGIIAMYQVNEVLKYLTGLGSLLTNTLVIYNALEHTQMKMKVHPTVSREAVKTIFKETSYIDPACQVQREDWLISPQQLKDLVAQQHANTPFEVIAVLPNLKAPFNIDQTHPIEDFNPKNISIDTSKTYVMVCQRGKTSYRATEMLKKEYPELKVLSLDGGLEAF